MSVEGQDDAGSSKSQDYNQCRRETPLRTPTPKLPSRRMAVTSDALPRSFDPWHARMSAPLEALGPVSEAAGAVTETLPVFVLISPICPLPNLTLIINDRSSTTWDTRHRAARLGCWSR